MHSFTSILFANTQFTIHYIQQQPHPSTPLPIHYPSIIHHTMWSDFCYLKCSWSTHLKTQILNNIEQQRQALSSSYIPTTSATVTRYRNVGSWIAPSIWTSSYFGVVPRLLNSSWSTDTGVFPTAADIVWKERHNHTLLTIFFF